MTKSEIKKLDQLWSKKVKERAGYKCESCLEEGPNVWLNSAHIIGRRYRTLRWCLDNGLSLCFMCHRAYDQHLPRADFIRRIVIGEERMNRLLAVKETIARDQDYEEIKRTLQ